MTSPIVPNLINPLAAAPLARPIAPGLGSGVVPSTGLLSRYVAPALRALSLAAVLSGAGCNAPQPAQPRDTGAASGSASHSASVASPPNQEDCTPASTDEFCRHMLGTERRVERMRQGRDEYNNRNTVLVGLAFLGGAGLTGLGMGAFYTGRWLIRRRRQKKAEAQTETPPQQPPPEKTASRRWRMPWHPKGPDATTDGSASPQPPESSEGTKKTGE